MFKTPYISILCKLVYELCKCGSFGSELYFSDGVCDLHLDDGPFTITTNTNVIAEICVVTRSFEQGG